jgi:ABC-type phosphate transport system permease subunit
MIWAALSLAVAILIVPIGIMLGLWLLERAEINEIDWREDD